MRVRFLALALALVLGACATVETALPPTVRIANLRPGLQETGIP